MSEKQGIISQVSKQGGRKRKLGPVLVNFEHGQVDDEAFEQLKAGLSYDFSEDQKTPDLKVFVRSKNLTYSNVTKSAKELPSNPYTKTWLAIRNRTTNQVRLVETNTVTLAGEVNFPKTCNPFLIESAKNPIVVEDLTKDQRLDRLHASKKHLVSEFGQTKGKRLAEQYERQKVDAEQKHDKLKSVADSIDASAILLPNLEAPMELTPPCFRLAKRIEEVYKIRDLLTESDLEYLEQAAVELQQEFDTNEKIDGAVSSKMFTEVFGSVLKRHGQLESDSWILGAAIYMEAIFHYLKMPPSLVKKGPKFMQKFIPNTIRQKVFDTFVPNGLVSEEQNDRAFCHALVVLFLVNNYSIDMKVLSASVRIRADRLKKLIQVTGASLITDQLTRRVFVTLKLPLVKFDAAKALGRPKKK